MAIQNLLEQFLMAVTAKEDVNPEIMLEVPKKNLEEPPQRPETPREGEIASARAARDLKDKLARDSMTLGNEERRERGPRAIHNICYNKLQKKLVSRLFLSLGTEGKKKFLKKPRGSIQNCFELALNSLQKVKCVTYERYKLFTRIQEQGDTLEAFHAAF